MVDVRFDVQGRAWSFNERLEYSLVFCPESEPEKYYFKNHNKYFSCFKCSASTFIGLKISGTYVNWEYSSSKRRPEIRFIMEILLHHQMKRNIQYSEESSSRTYAPIEYLMKLAWLTSKDFQII